MFRLQSELLNLVIRLYVDGDVSVVCSELINSTSTTSVSFLPFRSPSTSPRCQLQLLPLFTAVIGSMTPSIQFHRREEIINQCIKISQQSSPFHEINHTIQQNAVQCAAAIINKLEKGTILDATVEQCKQTFFQQNQTTASLKTQHIIHSAWVRKLTSV